MKVFNRVLTEVGVKVELARAHDAMGSVMLRSLLHIRVAVVILFNYFIGSHVLIRST